MLRNLLFKTPSDDSVTAALSIGNYYNISIGLFWIGYVELNSTIGSISPTTFCGATISACCVYALESSTEVHFGLSGEKVSDKIILTIYGTEYTLDWVSNSSRYVLTDETQSGEIGQLFLSNVGNTIDIGIKKG